jgi:hypothetical protein
LIFLSYREVQIAATRRLLTQMKGIRVPPVSQMNGIGNRSIVYFFLGES